MVILDLEDMAEDIRTRYDALTGLEQLAVEEIMDAFDYSLERALDIVESHDYEFHYKTTLADLAYEFIHEYGWEPFINWDPDTVEALEPYIDYNKLGAVLSEDGYRETSSGVIRVFW